MALGRSLVVGLIAVLLVGLTGPAPAQWLPEERRGLDDALSVGNLSPADLRYPRRVIPAQRVMPSVAAAIDDPIDAVNAVMGWHASGLRRSLGQAFALLDPLAEPIPLDPAIAMALEPPIPGLTPDVEAPIKRLIAAVAQANGEIRVALAGLSLEERRRLIEGLPQLAVEEPSIKFSFVRAPGSVNRDALLALADRVDRTRLRRAAVLVADAVQREASILRAATGDVADVVRTRIAGVSIAIGGRGPDRYEDADAMVTVDLGGDDRYLGRNGVGVGYASVVLDLGGDDRYTTSDLGVGTGLLGVGIARDEAGNDTYRSASLAFGAGVLGMGGLVDVAGDDEYVSSALAQGFGFYGDGVLIDNAGTDTYRAELFAQGAARTYGLGWLIDRAGSDTYRAGGRIPNSPLFADVHYSFSQGFGSGYREDTGGDGGGVGLLTDGAGDDAYVGETYCQAASYWYALGSVYDVAGHDSYRAYHYAQASAMHACAAFLFDLAGDDAYAVQFGAAHAIGHDYGVAVLLDRAGNDLYAARDSQPGIGNANGVGIVVDGAGEDRYAGPPGRANAARGTGSVGVFADLGGQDRYLAGLADGQASAGDPWSVALDVEDPTRPPARVDDGPAPAAPPAPGSLANPGATELARLYRVATQWGVGTAQADVEGALRQLVGVGLPAFEWMVNQRLAGADRLQLRAFNRLTTALGEPAQALVIQALASPDVNRVRNALSIVSEARIVGAGTQLSRLLDRDDVGNAAARAAGAIQAEACVPGLMARAGSRDPSTATIAAVALAQIGSETAFTTMQVLVRSPLLPVRQSAVNLMSRFPLRGQEVAKELLAEADPRLRRIGMELLSRIGTPTALDALGDRLLDPEPGVRMAALQGLAGRCPEPYAATFLGLKEDPVPLVRAIARRLSPVR